MTHPEPASFFDQDRARVYDSKWAKITTFKEALHFCLQLIFGELPETARVLIVGAGTGHELLYLAERFPTWNFTVVEPAEAMMGICRQHADDAGIAERCQFHAGYLNTLPPTSPHDAATSILVSHFLLDRSERIAFFAEIARQLRPGSYLVSADLVSDQTSAEYHRLLDIWLAMNRYAGVNFDPTVFDRDVAVRSPAEVESMLTAGGFVDPVLCYQFLLVHTWLSRMPSAKP